MRQTARPFPRTALIVVAVVALVLIVAIIAIIGSPSATFKAAAPLPTVTFAKPTHGPLMQHPR